MKSTTMHTRFAHIWNEVVDAMRDEDILSNRERLQLRYFLIQLRLPTVAANPNARTNNFAPEAQVWYCRVCAYGPRILCHSSQSSQFIQRCHGVWSFGPGHEEREICLGFGFGRPDGVECGTTSTSVGMPLLVFLPALFFCGSYYLLSCFCCATMFFALFGSC